MNTNSIACKRHRGMIATNASLGLASEGRRLRTFASLVPVGEILPVAQAISRKSYDQRNTTPKWPACPL